ncbi:MAG TPA: PAS domain-containing protein, partial [Rubrivivax sp.]|nr:PAS domain-containing protein [Rubrivivax sp.]
MPVLAFTRPSRRASVAAARAVPGALLAFGVIGGTALWFFGPPIGLAGGTTLAWWPHVLLLVLLARGGFTLPAATAAGVSTLATAATAVGAGPFGALPPIEAVQALSGYVGSLVAMLLVLRAAGQELRLRARRAATALATARLAVAEWHLQRPGEVHLSEDWRALTRQTDRRRWAPSAWLADVHPDDRLRLQQALEELAAGTQPLHDQELRVQSRDGWHWVEVRVLPSERDLAGAPLRLLATMTEVGERHEAQERQRLSASLFEHLHEGLLTADADLRVLDATPAYSAILGVPLAELLGSV